MKVERVLMTNERQAKKTGKRFYIQVVELISDDDKIQVKTMTNTPLSEGDNVRLPYLMTDFQNYGISVEVL